MTHEPECPTGKDWYEMCECDLLRSAYRRGREDAAKAVIRLIRGRTRMDEPEETKMQVAHNAYIDAVRDSFAAARGDGNHE